MAISSQTIHSLEVTLLKNIKNVTIEFKQNGLTGILGPNGSGKSTIIYALLCLYQPRVNSDRDNYRFSNFFTPTNYNLWAGSSFSMNHSFRDGPNPYNDQIESYLKRVDRWSPRYDRRPRRYVKFIGVADSIPTIESEKKNYRIRFDTNQRDDPRSNRILDRVGRIMNRNYTILNHHNSTHNQVYVGVQHAGINYTSLNMGAGEEKIFKIITEIEKSPNNGFFLIDEIDILIHHDALKRLMSVLNDYCQAKNLQIIFTTHSHSILEIDYVDFKHIQNTPQKTIVHTNTNTDSLFRLTGNQTTPYELFVEDELSKYIANQVAHELGVVREVTIKKLGATANCFTVASGAKLAAVANFVNMGFVLDGDTYRSEYEKRGAINRVLTGNVSGYNQMRNEVYDQIIEYSLPANTNPEVHIKNSILLINPDDLSVKEREIFDVFSDIQNPLDDHDFVLSLQQRIGQIQGVTLTYLVDLLSKSPNWIVMTAPLRTWLTNRIN